MSRKTPPLFWQRILSYSLIGFLVSPEAIWADVTGGIATDGTMGAVQTLDGVNVTVVQSLGTTVGNNLFHSFSEFNIAAGQTVTFTGADNLQNVFSRVTGTDITNIDGTLKSGIANAAFYFINPNGISFGENARVDVPGAFHVGTADKIDFLNNGAFYADGNRAGTLSSEAPAAFGFLDTSSANNSLIAVDGAQLAVNAGQTLDMVAGGIKLENNAGVNVSAGEVRLVAMQGSGSVGLERSSEGALPLPIVAPSATNAGQITVNTGNVDTSGNGGGRIVLWGGDVSFKNSKAQAANTGATDASSAKGIDIHGYSLSVDDSSVLSDALATGKTGKVTVDAPGSLAVVNAGTLGSTAYAQGDAGDVTVTANTLKIDSQGRSETGIGSLALSGSTGQVGNVSIKAGILAILNGGVVSSSTFSQGNAGSINVVADSLTIDSQGFSSGVTGIASQAELGSSGHAGDLSIQAGTLDILNGGSVSNSTFAQGDAGSLNVTADTLKIDGRQEEWAGIASAATVGSSGHAGNVTVRAGALDILNNGIISSDTLGQGNAGNLNIQAGNLDIRNNGIISSSTVAQGNAGSVTVTADTLRVDAQAGTAGIISGAGSGSDGQAGSVIVKSGALAILDGGKISSSTRGKGDAGSVAVTAGALLIDSQGFSLWTTGILSEAELGSSGHAGDVMIQAGTLNILNAGEVASSTFSKGDAGSVEVTADTLTINNQGSLGVTGIASQAERGSSGHAGDLRVQAGTLDILNNGVISSSTFAQGDAGNIIVMADILRIDGQQGGLTGIASAATIGSNGDAGNVIVQAGTLDILNSGIISSDTLSQGNAGSLNIQAGTLNIFNGAAISSSTFAQGNAGSVTVTADTLRIDGRQAGWAGIASGAGSSSIGQAGNIIVKAGTLDILNSGKILSSTQGQGGAGSVTVQAGTVAVRGGSAISSGSQGIDSSGRTGDVVVTTQDWLHLADGGRISIENEGAVSANAALIRPGSITVTARDIDMMNSEITSNSTGNIAAGNIVLNFSHWLTMEPSFISTTANTGNGGSITINGGDLIYLENSGFRTTVSGANSNGGDIFTQAELLVMNNGVIQANAVGGSGGNINLNLNSLIPSGNTLIKGGSTMAWQPFEAGFNVIQAASQAGVSGAVNVTAPQLNLSGIIANLGGPQFETSIIAQDYCGLGTGSSLTRKGAGGVKPKSGDQLAF